MKRKLLTPERMAHIVIIVITQFDQQVDAARSLSRRPDKLRAANAP